MKVLGIDIGGSGMKGAPVDTRTGELLAERYRVETPQPATPESVIEKVGEIARHFNWRGRIGCGFPAAILHGKVMTASNIDKAWIGREVASDFEKVTSCPTNVINDADAAGLAEVAFGAGKNRTGLLFVVTVGTGIGSALINSGKLVANTELGHLHFNGMVAEKFVADSIRKKEGLSWDEWGKRFDQYLVHIYRLFYPDMIIVGGGASKKFELYKKHLSIADKVMPAVLLNNAGIVGAALAGRSN